MSDSRYTLSVAFAVDDMAFVFAFRREVAEAKHFFDEDGKPTGNGGTWRTIEHDLRVFTRKHPDIFIEIEEETPDYDHKAKHHAIGGRYAKTEPELLWPEFTEDMLA